MLGQRGNDLELVSPELEGFMKQRHEVRERELRAIIGDFRG